MINKCYLYIDEYPRHASDIPFNITINWGDGSLAEQCSNVYVTKIPGFYHIYKDLRSYEITVTITNNCGTSTKKIQHVPFVPPPCGCYNNKNTPINNVMINFEAEHRIQDSDVNLTFSNCFSNVVLGNNDVVLTIVTDVASDIPLVTFRKKFEEIALFNLVSEGHLLEEASIIIPAGNFAELLYQSEESRKVQRVEIICDTNARTRLTHKGFEWTTEDSEQESWRGILIIANPDFIREWMFTFAGEVEDIVIGDAKIHSVHFYEEIQETEYDSPIMLNLALSSIENKQTGIFYYIDTNGKNHCVGVNELRCTHSDYEHMRLRGTNMSTTIRLDVLLPPDEIEYGLIETIVQGNVNPDCLPAIANLELL